MIANLNFKWSFIMNNVQLHELTISTVLMSACDLISTSTTDEWPPIAAQCNGVNLSYYNDTLYNITLLL